MKHSPTDDWTVVSDRYEVQSTEELQSISQAFGIGKKEQFAFWTNPMIDSPETKPTNRVTLSIWFWKDLIVRYYYQSTYLYNTWIRHSIPISISDATKIIRKTLTLFHFMILGCVENQFNVLYNTTMIRFVLIVIMVFRRIWHTGRRIDRSRRNRTVAHVLKCYQHT